MQWFDLLRRCKLSVYDKVYAFVRDADDACIRKIPVEVLAELSLGLLLGVFGALTCREHFCHFFQRLMPAQNLDSEPAWLDYPCQWHAGWQELQKSKVTMLSWMVVCNGRFY